MRTSVWGKRENVEKRRGRAEKSDKKGGGDGRGSRDGRKGRKELERRGQRGMERREVLTSYNIDKSVTSPLISTWTRHDHNTAYLHTETMI